MALTRDSDELEAMTTMEGPCCWATVRSNGGGRRWATVEVEGGNGNWLSIVYFILF